MKLGTSNTGGRAAGRGAARLGGVARRLGALALLGALLAGGPAGCAGGEDVTVVNETADALAVTEVLTIVDDGLGPAPSPAGPRLNTRTLAPGAARSWAWPAGLAGNAPVRLIVGPTQGGTPDALADGRDPGSIGGTFVEFLPVGGPFLVTISGPAADPAIQVRGRPEPSARDDRNRRYLIDRKPSAFSTPGRP